MRSAKELLLSVLLLGLTISQAAPVRTVTRTSETVDISRIRTYEEAEQLKLRRIWQAFKQGHVLTDDGLFEPAVPGADACPDNEEAQIAFLHHIKEHAIEVDVRDFIRCGDCNGTGKRYLREGDNLSSMALEHLPCAGTGKLEAIISYRLIYPLKPPSRLQSKNELRFIALSKRHEAGDSEADFELAVCHVSGKGTPKNVRRGCELFAQLATRKDARAAIALGQQIEKGYDGAEPSPASAIALYMLAQNLGGGSATLENAYRASQPQDLMVGSWLGRLLSREFLAGGVQAKDLTPGGIRRVVNNRFILAGERNMRAKGETELQDAMTALIGGLDRQPDLIAAHTKLLAAAGAGQPDALFSLGVFYENGMAVKRSRPAAYIFYALAASLGGHQHMQVAQTRLQPTCLSEPIRLMFDKTLDALHRPASGAAVFGEVIGLKDIEDGPVAMVVKPADEPAADIFDPVTGLKLKPRASGSGLIFTAQGHLFTNHHVVDKGKAFTVRIQGRGPLLKAKLLAKSESYDLAILQLEDWKGPGEVGYPLPSLMATSGSSTFARIGDRAFTIGFPLDPLLGADPKYSSGDISSASPAFDEFPGSMQITCPIQPGNSGGPLVLERGLVAGVVVGSLSEMYLLRKTKALPQGVNFAIHIGHLRDLAVRNGITVPEPARDINRPVDLIQAYTTQITSYE
jgi:S1-C subfamily serine protease